MILTEETWKRYCANQGYVYLVHAVGTKRYKIGRSINPAFRLEQLKGQSPYLLAGLECFWSPDAIADEKELHLEMEHLRVYGEWFELDEMTEEELDPSNYGPGYFERCSSSINGLRSWNFHAERPEIKALSVSLASQITSRMVAEIKGINYIFQGKKINDFCRWASCYLHGYIYFGLYDCQSLDSLLCLCNFLEKDWVPAINRSLSEFAIRTPSGDRCLEIAIHATLNGFLASISKGGEE